MRLGLIKGRNRRRCLEMFFPRSRSQDRTFGQAHQGKRSMVKRLMDFVLALLVLPVTMPVILVLMLIIRLETPGNPLFIQPRVGLGRKEFNLVKLRTMYIDTNHCPSHEVTPSKITSVGRFLRKTKLDELPQLWNVLRGDMSFVGPRPCLPSQKELISERDARGVYAVRPGITGPAQLAGIDMSTPRELAIADADYAANRSWRRDLGLIFTTALGKGSGDAVTRNC